MLQRAFTDVILYTVWLPPHCQWAHLRIRLHRVADTHFRELCTKRFQEGTMSMSADNEPCERAADLAAQAIEEWRVMPEGTGVCFAPVSSVNEARVHHRLRHREVYVNQAGRLQAAPAPRRDLRCKTSQRFISHVEAEVNDAIRRFWDPLLGARGVASLQESGQKQARDPLVELAR
jgi:crotonobetainyl-CoA:carnitine CoA-transferase CaiB-like acyl-CoA transferase